MASSDYDTDDERLILATIKILLLLLTACSIHRSLSPPNPSVKSEECCSGTEGTDTLFERVVQSITYCSKVCAFILLVSHIVWPTNAKLMRQCMVWLGVLCDIICILLRQFLAMAIVRALQSDWIQYVPKDYLDSEREKIPPMMVIGTILAVVSAALRTWCAIRISLTCGAALNQSFCDTSGASTPLGPSSPSRLQFGQNTASSRMVHMRGSVTPATQVYISL